MAGENSHAGLTVQELGNLAPLDLRNHREDRFRGDSNRSHLSEYQEEDQKILQHIYQALLDVFQEMLKGHHDSAHLCRVLTEYAHQRDLVSEDTRTC